MIISTTKKMQPRDPRDHYTAPKALIRASYELVHGIVLAPG